MVIQKIILIVFLVTGLSSIGCQKKVETFRPLGTLEQERERCYSSSIAGISQEEVKKRCERARLMGDAEMVMVQNPSEDCQRAIQTMMYSCFSQTAAKGFTSIPKAQEFGGKCGSHYQSYIDQSCKNSIKLKTHQP
jgi:hypothetical protein